MMGAVLVASRHAIGTGAQVLDARLAFPVEGETCRAVMLGRWRRYPSQIWGLNVRDLEVFRRTIVDFLDSRYSF
jgi:hypothetical protein